MVRIVVVVMVVAILIMMMMLMAIVDDDDTNSFIQFHGSSVANLIPVLAIPSYFCT